jgi:signal transduction histidine kinase
MPSWNHTGQDLDAAQAMVVATITHELRTPLTSIKGFAYALRTRHERIGEARRQEYLEIIEAQADYLTGIIDELLDLARQEEGRLSVHPLPLDVKALITRVIGMLGPRGDNHEIALTAAQALPQALADPVRSEQILRNLLDNAIKYAPSGTRIEIGARVEGEEMVVSVRDWGIGIPVSQQGVLFQRFSRVDNPITRASRGMGLGLYLARMLAEAMGGRIWVDTEEGCGATFAFTLPLA